MDWVEITARTVEEAREKALDLLGAAEDDTEVEVLAEPKMGLFGRVREEARVRARLLPALPGRKTRAAGDGEAGPGAPRTSPRRPRRQPRHRRGAPRPHH
ncbi:MAG: Jag N-terminal domain-containing protein, partial [Acidimicrobiales bacterium]